MPNLSASIGLAQLEKFDRFRARRLEIVRRYDRALRVLPGIRTLRHDRDGVVPFNYTLRVLDRRRDELAGFLRERGIGSWVHFIPCHTQPLFAGGQTHLPVTEKIYQEILCLPLHCELTDSDLAEVIDAVTDFMTTGATCRSHSTAC
jgi:dTDP-4-amino-4,6-dideoxygalactose transaminase